MKDSYSFDVNDECFELSYRAHRDAYMRIFDRFGFDYVIVKAMSGAMGGSKPAKSSWRPPRTVKTRTCAARPATTRPTSRRSRVPLTCPDRLRRPSASHVERHPETPTIESLVTYLNDEVPRVMAVPWTAADTLKNVVVMLVHPDGRREPLAIGVPGDREVDEKRLQAQVEPAEVDRVHRRRLHAASRRWPRATSAQERSVQAVQRNPVPGRSPGGRRHCRG